jgi:hypothetical protein
MAVEYIARQSQRFSQGQRRQVQLVFAALILLLAFTDYIIR